jgi:hypothetical protein
VVRLPPATAAALALGATITAGAQPQPHVDELLARVGERVAEFYNRAKNIICIETSTVQSIDAGFSPQGFARTVESELRLEPGSAGDAVVVRKIRKVGGRAPREEDKTNRSGCTDPAPVSTEPLAFLLPAGQREYRFERVSVSNERNRTVLSIDFASVNRRSKAELITDPGGHEDCFDWSGHIASKGRIRVDANTYDVLQVERFLPGPVDVRVPVVLQQRYRFENWIALVRDDVTIRYKTVAFSDPDEVLLLPESIESLTIVRGGLQSSRRSHRFSEYRRFVAEGRVVP